MLSKLKWKLRQLFTWHFWQGFERCPIDAHLRHRIWTKKQLEEQHEYFECQVVWPELIVSSAVIDDRTGNVYATLCPGRHHHVLRWMHERGFGRHVNHDTRQGFMTNKNRYIGREEARALAVQTGQVKEENLVHGREIFSEDLWATPEKYRYKPPGE